MLIEARVQNENLELWHESASGTITTTKHRIEVHVLITTDNMRTIVSVLTAFNAKLCKRLPNRPVMDGHAPFSNSLCLVQFVSVDSFMQFREHVRNNDSICIEFTPDGPIRCRYFFAARTLCNMGMHFGQSTMNEAHSISSGMEKGDNNKHRFVVVWVNGRKVCFRSCDSSEVRVAGLYDKGNLAWLEKQRCNSLVVWDSSSIEHTVWCKQWLQQHRVVSVSLLTNRALCNLIGARPYSTWLQLVMDCAKGGSPNNVCLPSEHSARYDVVMLGHLWKLCHKYQYHMATFAICNITGVLPAELVDSTVLLSRCISFISFKNMMFVQGQADAERTFLYRPTKFETWYNKEFATTYGSSAFLHGARLATDVEGVFGTTFELDISNMHATIIQNWNLSPETMVAATEETKADTLCPRQFTTFIEGGLAEEVVASAGYELRSIQSSTSRGVLPIVCEKLVQLRSHFKAQSAKDSADIHSQLMEKAVKAMLVRIAGSTRALSTIEKDNATTCIRCLAVYSAITTYSRVILAQFERIAIQACRDMGVEPRVVYGFTDSVGITLEAQICDSDLENSRLALYRNFDADRESFALQYTDCLAIASAVEQMMHEAKLPFKVKLEHMLPLFIKPKSSNMYAALLYTPDALVPIQKGLVGHSFVCNAPTAKPLLWGALSLWLQSHTDEEFMSFFDDYLMHDAVKTLSFWSDCHHKFVVAVDSTTHVGVSEYSKRWGIMALLSRLVDMAAKWPIGSAFDKLLMSGPTSNAQVVMNNNTAARPVDADIILGQSSECELECAKCCNALCTFTCAHQLDW